MITKLNNSLATNPAQSYLPNQVLSRAAFLRLAAGMGAALFGHQFAVAQTRDRGDAMQTRPIPSSGEALPVIGCGTYVGFDVGADSEKLKTLAAVVRTRPSWLAAERCISIYPGRWYGGIRRRVTFLWGRAQP